MKNIVLFLTLVCLISCNTNKSDEVADYTVEMKIKSINYYGDTISFEPPQIIQIKPNADEITEIYLGNGTRFGAKYYVSELRTGTETKLMHNAAFFNEVEGEWHNLNSIEHRHPFNLNEEKEWGIGVSNDGDTYFKIVFLYKVTEI